jgi:hypothetical protein
MVLRIVLLQEAICVVELIHMNAAFVEHIVELRRNRIYSYGRTAERGWRPLMAPLSHFTGGWIRGPATIICRNVCIQLSASGIKGAMLRETRQHVCA